MGVDNSGVLVVGQKLDEIDWSCFPDPDLIEPGWVEDDRQEWYYWNTDKLITTKLKWRLREPVGYERSGLFGFCLESPSYGVSEFDYGYFIDDLLAIDKCWRKWTGKAPVVYLMNLQS